MAFEVTPGKFVITVEVVPPVGSDPEPILGALENLGGLSVDAFSVATNPVAKPRMSALAFSALIQQRTSRPAILHCTTRDHNRLSILSLLWGARALGIESILASTGDFVASGEKARTSTVRDVDVLGLIRLARKAGLCTGVVLDPHPESNGLGRAKRRMAWKVRAGAQFVVTQPVYDEGSARELARATKDLGIPVIMGILPLRSQRHAEFLHEKVAGIAVPKNVRDLMRLAADPVATGVAGARDMLEVARERYAGACIMPPFDHYDALYDILQQLS